MKKMLLKFADNLLSKEQMKEVKGGHDYCKILDNCYASVDGACFAAATNWNMYLTCRSNQTSQCTAMFASPCVEQAKKW